MRALATEDVREAAHLAGRAAREVYLARVPEPAPVDFACPYCLAEPGCRCWVFRRGRQHHYRREARAVVAERRRYADAARAGRAVNDIRLQLAEGRPAAEVARSLPKRSRVPYLVARGWEPIHHRWRLSGTVAQHLDEQAVLAQVMREEL